MEGRQLIATTVLGTIPTWILVAMAVFVAWRVSRGGAGSAVSELSTANTVLERRIHELGGEVRDLRVENAELKGKTDVTIALAPILEWSTSHERNAAERHLAILKVLDLIAARLGPDPNGNGSQHE